jgi:hypothetical protein
MERFRLLPSSDWALWSIPIQNYTDTTNLTQSWLDYLDADSVNHKAATYTKQNKKTKNKKPKPKKQKKPNQNKNHTHR